MVSWPPVLAGVSYRRAAWLPAEAVRVARAQLLRNFLCRGAEASDGVDPEWLRVERVVARRARGGRARFLVKARPGLMWRGRSSEDAAERAGQAERKEYLECPG